MRIGVYCFILLIVSGLCRENFVCDPKVDAVVAIACSYVNSYSVGAPKCVRQVLALRCPQLAELRFQDVNIDLYSDEVDLLNAFIDRVNDLDPDILVGWDTERSSWGYIAARGAWHGKNSVHYPKNRSQPI